MMPPTSIDGTDITGATIDGTDVTEITVDGQTVFTAGPKIIDDFEDGNINEYTGDTGAYSIETSNPISGSNSLRASMNENKIFSISGLNNYPSAGDKFSYKMKTLGGNMFSAALFGVQPNLTEFYAIHFGLSTTFNNTIARVVKDDATQLAQFSVNFNQSDVFRFEVDWKASGGFDIDIFNDNTNTNVGSNFVSDSTYTSGGIGCLTRRFSSGDPNHDCLYDDFLIL